MMPEQFTYWLQGFAELNTEPPTPEQWKSIQEHLATVFNKVTPPVFVPNYKSPEDWKIPNVTCSIGDDD